MRSRAIRSAMTHDEPAVTRDMTNWEAAAYGYLVLFLEEQAAAVAQDELPHATDAALLERTQEVIRSDAARRWLEDSVAQLSAAIHEIVRWTEPELPVLGFEPYAIGSEHGAPPEGSSN